MVWFWRRTGHASQNRLRVYQPVRAHCPTNLFLREIRTPVGALQPVSSADTRRHLRSANRHLLTVPRFRLNTYGRRAFSVAGPLAWNSLPDFIRDPTSSTDCFRRLLETYLFARYWCIQRIAGSNDYMLYKSTHSECA